MQQNSYPSTGLNWDLGSLGSKWWLIFRLNMFELKISVCPTSSFVATYNLYSTTERHRLYYNFSWDPANRHISLCLPLFTRLVQIHTMNMDENNLNPLETIWLFEYVWKPLQFSAWQDTWPSPAATVYWWCISSCKGCNPCVTEMDGGHLYFMNSCWDATICHERGDWLAGKMVGGRGVWRERGVMHSFNLEESKGWLTTIQKY